MEEEVEQEGGEVREVEGGGVARGEGFGRFLEGGQWGWVGGMEVDVGLAPVGRRWEGG